MSFATLEQALDSLREFSPEIRARHHIVKFWSRHFKAYRYARVFEGGKQ